MRMVSMSQIDLFTTDNFRVLAHLYDKRSADNKTHITQQEVADNLKLSRITINKIIGELKSAGYITPDGNHNGRYVLSDEAVMVIKMFRNVNKK